MWCVPIKLKMVNFIENWKYISLKTFLTITNKTNSAYKNRDYIMHHIIFYSKMISSWGTHAADRKCKLFLDITINI